MKFFKSILLICVLLSKIILIACNKQPVIDSDCPNFHNYPSPTYQSPIAHPLGEIIGFNYRPIKKIEYNYGYDCPLQANYIYDETKAGFWIADSSGNNMRQVFPFYLHSASWSPDGNWIVFTTGNIYIMPFDGENFDTTSVVQLTDSGHDASPSWSRDGKYISYSNKECGSAVNPPPDNGCGILIKNLSENETRFIIGNGRSFSYWGPSNDTLFYALYYYDLVNNTENVILDNNSILFTLRSRPLYHPNKNKIFFTGDYTYVDDTTNLYSIDPSGSNFHLVSNEPIKDFSFTPEGKIIYVLYDGYRLDEDLGTIWIMNDDGTNKRQLTKNTIEYSYR